MDLIRESLAITIVFLLLWAALWLLKKKGALGVVGTLAKRSAAVACLEVIDKVRLTPQHSVHVVSVDGRRMVVGVHPSGFTLLEAAPATLEAAPATMAHAAGDTR